MGGNENNDVRGANDNDDSDDEDDKTIMITITTSKVLIATTVMLTTIMISVSHNYSKLGFMFINKASLLIVFTLQIHLSLSFIAS